jgi:hypothetical protein
MLLNISREIETSPDKSGVGDIEIGEIVEEEVVKKKSGRVRPIPKEEVEED